MSLKLEFEILAKGVNTLHRQLERAIQRIIELTQYPPTACGPLPRRKFLFRRGPRAWRDFTFALPARLARRVTLLFTLTVAAHFSPAIVRAADYEAHSFKGSNGGVIPYRLLAPQTIATNQKYPLVLLLHGADGNGTNNTAQLIHGAAMYRVPSIAQQFPCFVVVPQCPPNRDWVYMSTRVKHDPQPLAPSAAMRLVIELLHQLPEEHPIDLQRIYVTGMSMGGFGAWDILTRLPNQFAAVVPICGGGDETTAARAARVPVWAFHSSDDGVVPVQRARNMIAALRAAGGTPRYTEYTGFGHGCYGQAYREPDLLPWMFSQRLGQPATFQPATVTNTPPATLKFPEPTTTLAGAGPIRPAPWYRALWYQKHLAWSQSAAADQGAVVFAGDGLMQSWLDQLAPSFPNLKTANRGLNGDTSRSLGYRLNDDVLALHPRAVVLLVGTNDLELQGPPETTASNLNGILNALKNYNPKLPVILCRVLPSDASKGRPVDQILRLNTLLTNVAKNYPQVTLVDTWTPFADTTGNARASYFIDRLHLNLAGYEKWAAILRPVFDSLNIK